MNDHVVSIAVLMTVHNRRRQTLACLENLYNQKGIDGIRLDVYMTDDGCTDGTPNAVLEHYPHVNIVGGDGNLFWNRGMIKAWEAAEINGEYDYFLWLNDDTELYDTSLSSMIEFASQKSGHDIVVGTTVDHTGHHVTYGGRLKYGGLIKHWESPATCDTFNGNIVLISRRVYNSIGKLDWTFHHGIGDSDYGLRATEAGFSCVIAPNPVGICDPHEKLPKWCDPTVPLFSRIKYLYAPGGNGNNPIQFFIFKKRHYGILSAIKSFITNHIRVLFPWINKKTPDKY